MSGGFPYAEENVPVAGKRVRRALVREQAGGDGDGGGRGNIPPLRRRSAAGRALPGQHGAHPALGKRQKQQRPRKQREGEDLVGQGEIGKLEFYRSGPLRLRRSRRAGSSRHETVPLRDREGPK